MIKDALTNPNILPAIFCFSMAVTLLIAFVASFVQGRKKGRSFSQLREHVRQLDAVLDDEHVAVSCINSVEDLRRAIRRLKQDAADARTKALQQAADACERLRSSGENDDNWTITRDLAFRACADAIKELK